MSSPDSLSTVIVLCHLSLSLVLRRRADSNRRIKVLQTSPLPLGYVAVSPHNYSKLGSQLQVTCSKQGATDTTENLSPVRSVTLFKRNKPWKKAEANKNPATWWDWGWRGHFKQRKCFQSKELSVRLPEAPLSRAGRDRAGNGIRTRDINLGKVALYQLSYSRIGRGNIIKEPYRSK
jgi:hypothetical protein